MSEQWILAIDTATENLGVCLWCVETNQAFSVSQLAARKHGALLHPSIQELCEKAGIAVKDLSAVVSTRGPGSYTGIRIGMAAAQGFADALDIPFVTCTTLEVFPQQVQAENLTVWIEAHGGDMYVQVFEGRQALSEPEALPTQKAVDCLKEGVTLVGNGVLPRRGNIPENITVLDDMYISPLVLAKMGWDKIKNGVHQPEPPLYVHALTYKKSFPKGKE